MPYRVKDAGMEKETDRNFLRYLFDCGEINKAQYAAFRHFSDMEIRDFFCLTNILEKTHCNFLWREYMSGKKVIKKRGML